MTYAVLYLSIQELIGIINDSECSFNKNESDGDQKVDRHDREVNTVYTKKRKIEKRGLLNILVRYIGPVLLIVFAGLFGKRLNKFLWSRVVLSKRREKRL